MKYALVTGAAGGMGRSTVSALLRQGYRVFALDKNCGEGAENLTWLQTDITDEAGVLAAFETVNSQTDHLDAVVHFTGIYMLDSLVEMTPQAFETIFKVNLYGAYLVNRTFLPLLKQGSRILMTTSELAPLDPLPFTGIYGITKSALDKYAYSLRMELQLLGIHISVLRAGAVDTDMLGVSTDALDRFCSKTKLYSCNAKRFKDIVNRVEARHIPAQKLACKVLKILNRRKPKFSYAINRNPLLRLLHILPKRMQLWAIKKVLQE